MRKPVVRSLKMKVTALVLCGIILATIAVGGASILNSQRVVSADSTQIMNLLCANRAEEIDALFTRIEQSVETLKVYATQQLGDVKQFQTDSDYVEAYTQKLQNVAVNAAENTEGAMTVYIRYNPEIAEPTSGIFCQKSAADGAFHDLQPTNLSLYAPTDRQHVAWYYEPVQQKSGVWLTPYFNENIYVDMISYGVPYYIDNILIGVIGMDIDFGVLENIIESTTLYQTGYAFLTDAQGNIIHHSDLSRGTDLSEYNQGEFRSMVLTLRENTSNGSSLVEYCYRGTQKLAAFQDLTNGMKLVVTAPHKEINHEANFLIIQIVGASLMVIVIGTVWAVLYTRRLARPLLELTEAARKIASGDLSVSITHRSEDEVGNLAESFRQTVAHLHKYISYINELAYQDSLTGVKNKTAYLEHVNRLDGMAHRKQSRYAVIVFDINNLKQVNDAQGHEYGDLLIIEASKLISEVFKHSPIYRIGGDEFVAVLEEFDYDHYEELLKQFVYQQTVWRTIPQEQQLSIAQGIVVYTEETDLSYSDVFKRADGAMYQNKEEMKKRLAGRAVDASLKPEV